MQEDPEPTKEHKAFVDTLIFVSHYEVFFHQYCESKIVKEANRRKWDIEEVQKRKDKINFTDYKNRIMYRSYLDFTDNEMQTTINFFRLLNAKRNEFHYYFIADNMIINNLDGYINSYLLYN